MSLILSLLAWLCATYSTVLFVRLIVEILLGFVRSPLPKPIAVAAEVLYVITDPPVKLARRLIPPLTLGPVQFDFGIFIAIFFFNVLGIVLNGLS